MRNDSWVRSPAWLHPSRVRFVCGAIVAVSVLLATLSFATTRQGCTFCGKGPPLGNDFAGFFVAATLLTDPATQNDLYETAASDTGYHQLLPGVPESEKLPYLHPPFVALAFRPLATLPYSGALAIWLLASVSMYLAGLLLAWHVAGLPVGPTRRTGVLVALAFEPFVMECWLGGQLSALALFAMALAWTLERRGRPYSSGLALGLCLYKPTLLVLLLPMAVIARRWRMLSGFLAMALVLAVISVVGAGWENLVRYGETLSRFAKTTIEPRDGFELKLWKYVDVNSFVRLLTARQSIARWALIGGGTIILFLLLVPRWWYLSSRGRGHADFTWSTTLIWTLVANLYVGVYDTVLALLGIVIAAGAFWRQRQGIPGPFTRLVALLILVGWVTQPVARATGLQTYTLMLVALGANLLAAARHAGARKDELLAAVVTCAEKPPREEMSREVCGNTIL